MKRRCLAWVVRWIIDHCPEAVPPTGEVEAGLRAEIATLERKSLMAVNALTMRSR
jgi:hypothetical protein